MSRIGKMAISLPEKVSVDVRGSIITVSGPMGELQWDAPKYVELTQEGGSISITTSGKSRIERAMHGTSRSLVCNMVEGVTKGFEKKLEILGVGFKAALKDTYLDLSLGKSHPIHHPIPAGLTVKVDDNTKITVSGIDKQLVGQFAAEVRSYYPPEPYKGKGVRYAGEVVRRKAGKSAQK